MFQQYKTIVFMIVFIMISSVVSANTCFFKQDFETNTAGVFSGGATFARNTTIVPNTTDPLNTGSLKMTGSGAWTGVGMNFTDAGGLQLNTYVRCTGWFKQTFVDNNNLHASIAVGTGLTSPSAFDKWYLQQLQAASLAMYPNATDFGTPYAEWFNYSFVMDLHPSVNRTWIQLSSITFNKLKNSSTSAWNNPATGRPKWFTGIIKGTYFLFWDEIRCYEVDSLTDTTIPNDCLFSWEVPAPTILLNVSTVNESNESKIHFLSGEDFFIYADLHFNNGTRIPTAECNISGENMSIEIDLSDDNFLLNDNSYTELLEFHVDGNEYQDVIHFYGCRDGVNIQSSVNLSCPGSEHIFILNQSNYPVCPNKAFFFLEYDGCIAEENLTVTFTALSPTSTTINISSPAIDRFSDPHQNLWGTEVYYNTTTKTYTVDHQHEYYFPGNYDITTECKVGALYYSDTLTIELGDYAPEIFIGNVYNNNESVSAGDNITFSDSNFTFDYSVSDVDLTWVSFNLTNSSGQIYFRNDSTPFTVSLSKEHFIDFQANPFNVTIKAGDSNGNNSQEYYTFSVTDLIAPICLGFVNTSILMNNTYNWSVLCYDEASFSFNITCSNGYTYYEDNIASSSYYFTLGSPIGANTSCVYEFCDGHTNNVLSKDFKARKLNNSIEIENKKGKNIFRIVGESPDITLKYKGDRITYTLVYADKTKKMRDYTYRYTTTKNSYHIPSNTYLGWIVDAGTKTWFDMNNEDKSSQVTVNQLNRTEYEIIVTTDEYVMTFESIGELNCITGTQFIEAVDAPGYSEYDPEGMTLTEVIFLASLFIVVSILSFIAYYSRVPALLIMVGVMWMFFGVAILKSNMPYFYSIIGIVLLPIGMVMIGSAIGMSRR